MEGVLCGNGSHNRVTRIHVRPSFGSMDPLVSGDFKWGSSCPPLAFSKKSLLGSSDLANPLGGDSFLATR